MFHKVFGIWKQKLNMQWSGEQEYGWDPDPGRVFGGCVSCCARIDSGFIQVRDVILYSLKQLFYTGIHAFYIQTINKLFLLLPQRTWFLISAPEVVHAGMPTQLAVTIIADFNNTVMVELAHGSSRITQSEDFREGNTVITKSFCFFYTITVWPLVSWRIILLLKVRPISWRSLLWVWTSCSLLFIHKKFCFLFMDGKK